MTPSRLCASAMVALALAAPMAQAQINPFRSERQGQGLSQADTDMLMKAGAELNGRTPAKIGAVEHWSNPDTGRSGTVKVTRLFEWHGLACHTVRYDIAGKPARSTYTLDWCKTQAGWKIKS